MWSTIPLFFLLFLGPFPDASGSRPLRDADAYMRTVVKKVNESVISRNGERLLSFFDTSFRFRNCYDTYNRDYFVRRLLSQSTKDFALKIVRLSGFAPERLEVSVKATGIKKYEKISAKFSLNYRKKAIMSGKRTDCAELCTESDGDNCEIDMTF